jgi:hypothetical protein
VKTIFLSLFLSAWGGLGIVGSAWAESEEDLEVAVDVTVDRSEIGADESLALKFQVKANAQIAVRDPTFHAPDFDLLHQFPTQGVESIYENGRFLMRVEQTWTYVLRPRTTGKHKIQNLSIKVADSKRTWPDLTVTVKDGGQGTPPPSGRTGAPSSGGGAGLRGTDQGRVGSAPFFVRAEVDQSTVYKGEQMIVSYYLYQRSRIFNLGVEKYPVLEGFIREELEMPVLQQRLEWQPTVVSGVPYQRALLVRYAAYPLREGKLPIDTMALKGNYYSQRFQDGEEDDPFFSLFRQMTPKAALSKSEIFQVEVLPIPLEGRPQNFSGLVGKFEISASVDRSEGKTGEMLTYTLRIDGKGNLSSLEVPKLLGLPEGMEVYSSRSQTKSGKGATGYRAFEYLLVPRQVGDFTLPSQTISFFNPESKRYESASTIPIQLKILQGRVRGQDRDQIRDQNSKTLNSPESGSLPSDSGFTRRLTFGLKRMSSVLQVLAYLLLGAQVLLGFVYFLKQRGALEKWRRSLLGRRSSRKSVDWGPAETAVQRALQPGASDQTVVLAYGVMEETLHGFLTEVLGVPSRGKTLVELRNSLVEERKLPHNLWDVLEKDLEFFEHFRFASLAGAIRIEQSREVLSSVLERVRRTLREWEKWEATIRG